MAFTVGSRSSSPASKPASSGSSQVNAISANGLLRPSGSKRTPIPDERTSLLSSEGPRRSWTADLDAVQVEDDGRAPSGAEDGTKRDDENQSLLSRDDNVGSSAKRKSMKRVIRQRAKYYIPMTEWLPNYSWSLFSGDLVAGISLACLLIPQSISYANGLAKLSPIAGLWSAAIPAFVYGILGTCRQLSIGPEAALSLLIGQMVQDQVYGDPHTRPEHPNLEAAAIAVVTTFQIGLITSALGLLRLGFLDVVLSRPLLRGFITAVGIIIFIEQLVPMLGLAYVMSHPEAQAEPPQSPLEKLFFVIDHIDHVNKTTVILAFGSLAVMILIRSIKPRVMHRPGASWVKYVPEIFLVVVIGTVVTGWFRLDERGVDILGKVKAGHGSPLGWPLTKKAIKYSDYTFSTAFVCAVIGIVDSIVAARENGTKYGHTVGPNRELVALGAANLTSSLFVHTGCVPIFGSVTRSRLNGTTGARTQMSSIITGILIVLSIFFLLPWLHFLPKATLAAIVVLVVYAILAEAPHEIMFVWRMRAWTDFLQMTGTFLFTLCFSIEVGLVASVVFSLVLVIQKSTQTRIKIIGRLPGTDEWVPIDEDESAQEEIPGVLVVRIRENLSFANTGQLKERLRRLERYGMQKSHPSDEPRRDSAKALILHMGDVEEIDASAVAILEELTKAYTESGVGVHFAHLRPSHLRLFELVGITNMVGHSHFHSNLRTAMHEIESLGFGTTTSVQFPV